MEFSEFSAATVDVDGMVLSVRHFWSLLAGVNLEAVVIPETGQWIGDESLGAVSQWLLQFFRSSNA
ncbi:MAG: hypothetical protein ACFB5Z_13720 [Elainellaceae cyanobacterium]